MPSLLSWPVSIDGNTKVTPLDRQVRIANRAMRMVFQIVGGLQVWRGKGVNPETILDKLREFHRGQGP